MQNGKEPGYYSDGNFGIRLENDMIIVEAQTPFKFGGKSFYTFESLTWVCLIINNK